MNGNTGHLILSSLPNEIHLINDNFVILLILLKIDSMLSKNISSIKSTVRFVSVIVCLSGCMAGGIPISTNTKYPIEVLYTHQTPEIPYEEISWLELSNSDILRDEQTKNDKMLKRGNDAKTKQLLTSRLVAEAQKIGADALINVTYQYYTTVNSEGYTLKGLAVKYKY